MSNSFTLWTLIRHDGDGFAVTVSAIALRSDDFAYAGHYLAERCDALDHAKSAGTKLAARLGREIAARGDQVISNDTTIDISGIDRE